MVNKMSRINQFTNVGALQLQHASAQLQPKTVTNAKSNIPFADLLNQKAGNSQSLKFSKHATQRVQERGIEVTEGLLSDLSQAVQKAREKGAKDVVVIGQNGAFIVNVPSNVVITTMTGTEMKENIFTNIDSAVLI